MRVDADSGINIGIVSGELYGCLRTGNVYTNGDDSFDPMGMRRINDSIEVLGISVHIKVTVGIDEFGWGGQAGQGGR